MSDEAKTRPGTYTGNAPTYPRRALGIATVIIVTGPLIGGLIFIGAFGVKELVGSSGREMRSLLEVAIYARQLIFASYVIGLVPALLSSIWIGWLTYRQGTFSYGQGIAGAIIMTIVLPGTIFYCRLSCAARRSADRCPISSSARLWLLSPSSARSLCAGCWV